MRVCLLATMMALGSTAARAMNEPVRTENGLLEGRLEGVLSVFRGVPFAAPPVGALRWRAPQPPTSWAGIRAADLFENVCPQHGSYPEDSPLQPMSEDCLYLNVWTPAKLADEKLPVMVWIHGGGMRNGSGSEPLYSGEQLARRGVILVTLNYRLGALGFLAHPQLSRESPSRTSGNYGLLDQIAALQWIHRNIASFGGDPQNVTVFGQSTGSISVSVLVTSPSTPGLFQRAIGESGALFEPIEASAANSLKGAEKAGEAFVKTSGAMNLDALRTMAAATLLDIHFTPVWVLDGEAMPRSPFETYSKGKENPVDLLIGSNAEEGSSFLQDRTLTPTNMDQELSKDFPSLIVRLIGPPRAADDSAARNAYISFEGDMRFAWDMHVWARLHAAAGKRRVFFYRFDRTPPYAEGSPYAGLGASHGMEMPYVFDHLDQQSLSWTEGDRRLAANMAAYWTNFAKTGNPNAAGLPLWPAFTLDESKTVFLNSDVAAGKMPLDRNLPRIDRLYRITRMLVDLF